MDNRKVTIKVSDRTYSLKASSEEKEELMRKAAAIINQKVDNMRATYPGKDDADLLTFVALSECVNSLALRKKFAACEQETKQLEADLVSYLENIKA